MKLLTFSIAATLFLGLVKPTYAHDPNLPPFLKINGAITRQNTVPEDLVSSNEFVIAQDVASETYLAGNPITFTLEKEQLPIIPDMVERGRFLWDFGDEQTGEGLTIVHTYAKPGTYIQKVYFTVEDLAEPLLLQSTLLHVVPEKGYRVPEAKLAINDTLITDSYNQVVIVDLTKPVVFSAEQSVGTGKFVEYMWDFGNANIEKSKNAKFSQPFSAEELKESLPVLFIVLRVRDENGFFADTYGQIENTMTTEAIAKRKEGSSTIMFAASILGIGLLLAGAGYLAQKYIKFK